MVRACFECLVPPFRAYGKTAAGLPGSACRGRRRESKRSCASRTDSLPWLRLRPASTMSVCTRTPVGTLRRSYRKGHLEGAPLASLRLFTFDRNGVHVCGIRKFSLAG